jgi:hypothetical protein
MTKVLCIDAGNRFWCFMHGIMPLNEGQTYTVRAEVVGMRGEGYLLHEIHNRCNVKDSPGLEPSYHKRRFIPLTNESKLTDYVNEPTATPATAGYDEH